MNKAVCSVIIVIQVVYFTSDAIMPHVQLVPTVVPLYHFLVHDIMPNPWFSEMVLGVYVYPWQVGEYGSCYVYMPG